MQHFITSNANAKIADNDCIVLGLRLVIPEKIIIIKHIKVNPILFSLKCRFVIPAFLLLI